MTFTRIIIPTIKNTEKCIFVLDMNAFLSKNYKRLFAHIHLQLLKPSNRLDVVLNVLSAHALGKGLFKIGLSPIERLTK